jgi:type I protein arginine methyltransferase
VAGYDDSAVNAYDFHHSMLADRRRTESFLRAIVATVRAGDVVVDIGCGSGVLSMFAAMAGARVVYAIERESIIDVAREVVNANGMGDKIIFIAGSSVDVELPELADVVISETIGNVGFDEGLLAWAADARERLAVPGARFIPSDVALHGSIVEMPFESRSIDRFTEPLLSLDFGALRRLAVNNVMWTELSPVSLLAEPTRLFGGKVGLVGGLSGSARFGVRRRGRIHGFGGWFTAGLTDSLTISNAPPNLVPSWDHGFFPVATPFDVVPGDTVEVVITMSMDGATWTWTIGDQAMSTDHGKIPLNGADDGNERGH